MANINPDQQETGFAFTDEDFGRRYSPDPLPPAQSSAAPATAPPAIRPARRLHGGGNSFMRARRRRLAAFATD